MATRNTPRSGGGHAVAIDVGMAAIRVVEVQTGSDPQILRRGTAPLESSVWDDLAASRDTVVAALRSALSSAGISAGQVVAALPRRLVTLKYVRLPHAEPAQIRGMVQFEAQQYIPFPMDDVVLDHQVVSDETEELTTVMIVAARRSLVDNLLAAFDKAGLDVTRLSVSALALSEHGTGPLPLALVDLDAGEMDMAVVSAGRILFSRSATLGGATLHDVGGARLATEVVRSLSAYQNEFRGQPVARLLVAGSPTDLPIMEEFLGGTLEMPVSRMNGTYLSSAGPDALAYATAAGLALEADGLGIGRINLVPTARLERKETARKRASSFVALGLGAAALVGLAAWLLQTVNAQSKEQRDAVQANQKLDYATAGLKKSQAENAAAARDYQVVAIGLNKQKPVVDVIKSVSDAAPKTGGVHLTELGFERGGSLVLHGTSQSEAGATDFVLNLQSSGAFREVRFNYLGDAATDQSGRAAGAAPNAKPGTPGASTQPAKPLQTMNFIITCRVPGADQKIPPDKLRPTTPVKPIAVATTSGGRSNP